MSQLVAHECTLPSRAIISVFLLLLDHHVASDTSERAATCCVRSHDAAFRVTGRRTPGQSGLNGSYDQTPQTATQ